MTAPTLRTRRLTLRPMVASDAPAIMAALNVHDVAKWLSAPPYPYTAEDAAYFIREIVPTQVIWAIDTGTGLIGSIGVKPDLGYWLDQRFHGQGIMSEAAAAAVTWFFGHDSKDLISGHFFGNTGSRTILSRLGFADTHMETVTPPATGEEVALQRMILTRDRWLSRNPLRIETERLVIRELNNADVEDLSRIGGDPAVAPMLMSVTSPWPVSRVASWIEAAKYQGKPGFRAGIETKDGTLIGTIGLGPLSDDGSASLMYFVAPSQWGQGFASEAAQAFLRHCWQNYPLRSVFAGYFDENPASGKVLAKLGFVKTGEVMGTSAARTDPAPETLMTLTLNDWQAKHG